MLGSKTTAHFQQFRLPRYSTEGFQDSLVELQPTATSKIFRAEPINFSKYGLAFRLKEDPQLRIAPLQKINSLRFRAFGKTFFDGEVEVKHATPAEGRLTVGVYTHEKNIEVEEILGSRIGYNIVHNKDSYFAQMRGKKNKEEYQLIIAQFKDYMAEMKEALDKTQKEISSFSLDEQEKIGLHVLKSVEESFREQSMYFYNRISEICAGMNGDEIQLCKTYFQSHLHDLILPAPFVKRCVEKPLGYSGDYEVMNMIYGDHYSGNTLYAKLQNRFCCTFPAGRANIDRLNFFKQKIQQTVENVLKKNEKVKITSLGSGPAKEILDFIDASGFSEKCVFTCVDLEPKALEYSKKNFAKTLNKTNKNVHINFVLANVVSFLRAAPPDFMFEQDLIYASGIFDYLKLSVAQKLTNSVFKLIKKGGELIIVNISVSNPCRLGIEFAGEWFMNHRTKEEMLSLVEDLKDYQKKDIFLDREKVYWFLSIQK